MATATLAFFKPAFTLASNDLIKNAIALESQDPKSALELFLKIDANDSHYKLAIEELIKLYYRRGEWPEFFSYAQYYRKRYPLHERNETQLLEPLALLRHCQTELVAKFVSEYKKEVPKYAEQLDQMAALANTKFKGKAASQASMKSLQKHLSGISLWPLPAKEIAKVDPKKLRIEVENRCSF